MAVSVSDNNADRLIFFFPSLEQPPDPHASSATIAESCHSHGIDESLHGKAFGLVVAAGFATVVGALMVVSETAVIPIILTSVRL